MGSAEPSGNSANADPAAIEHEIAATEARIEELIEVEESELDYRFTLANERTFLAWMRTALGLLAGGVAVHELVKPFRHHGVRSAVAMSCIVLAGIIALGAYGRWRHVQAAMQAGAKMPRTLMVPILAAGIAIIAVLAGIGLLLS
ncbi:YidH family protein [Nocardia sp. NPDC058058]|uniref:YidH family protein n=1 Tax=Nocardia sp. NPDC058058 TaxID=3346317 RepID=UPI0036DF961A